MQGVMWTDAPESSMKRCGTCRMMDGVGVVAVVFGVVNGSVLLICSILRWMFSFSTVSQNCSTDLASCCLIPEN